MIVRLKRRLLRASLILALLAAPGCARRVQVHGAQITLDDRVVDAIVQKAGDVEAVLKSDLPAQAKQDLVLKIYEKRLEALKEILLREADKGKNWVAVLDMLLSAA